MKKWILAVAATVFIAVIALTVLLLNGSGEQAVTADEAEQAVISLYGGNIEQTEETGDYFVVGFTKTDGRYNASVNKNTAQVESMELIERAGKEKKLTQEEASDIAVSEFDGTVEELVFIEGRNEYEVRIAGADERAKVYVSAETGEVRKVSTETLEPETERIITSEEAAAIARKTLEGEVQEIEFTQTQDGGYYLVEIENDEADQEVTVQVHAIRGETMTVEWDD